MLDRGGPLAFGAGPRLSSLIVKAAHVIVEVVVRAAARVHVVCSTHL